jgi:site-specific recombinase XerD
VLRGTFAIQWISDGGDPFSLQRLLGHTTMEMVNRYVRLSTADLQRSHAIIGLVDRLKA